MRMKDEKPRKIMDGIYNFNYMEPGIYRVKLTSKAFVVVLDREPYPNTKKIVYTD